MSGAGGGLGVLRGRMLFEVLNDLGEVGSGAAAAVRGRCSASRGRTKKNPPERVRFNQMVGLLLCHEKQDNL